MYKYLDGKHVTATLGRHSVIDPIDGGWILDYANYFPAGYTYGVLISK